MRIACGSTNPVKIEAVTLAFKEITGKSDIHTDGIAVEKIAPEQPFDTDIWAGAFHRARSAKEIALLNENERDISAGKPDIEDSRPSSYTEKNTDKYEDNKYSYFVGIESGFFTFKHAAMQVQCCIILDREDRIGCGVSEGFMVPLWAVEGARKGNTLEAMFSRIAGEENIGRKGGAISYLTSQKIRRTDLVKNSVLMAFIPFLNQNLYFRS
ncbi:MAG: inosine/xanthosine triphosphatase [Thermoplasmata archaeon]